MNPQPTWTLKGTVLVACNCDYGCPCNFNARPSRGFCQGGWVWVIEQGRVDEMYVRSFGVSLFAKWRAAIHEGGGHATCYINDRATDAQRAALTRIVRGELGGPWGMFIKTYELAGPVAAPFDVRIAQHGSHARIGDVVTIEFEKIRNPVTQAEV